jgi:peptidoglycan/xylan/chitin deacetylase (PgdA/CDA1 family)
MSAPVTLHRVPRRPWAWLWVLVLSQLGVAWIFWSQGLALGLVAMFASHALFVLPVFLPRLSLYGPVLSRLPTSERQVWLTIDDGPSDDTEAMLDLLQRHGARATFFLVGERALARPGLVARIRQAGHGIGNHSHTHPQARFWRLGPAAMAAQIGQAQQALATTSGVVPRWYRSVVGHTNPFVAPAQRRHGLARVAWSARGYDAVDGDVARVLARIDAGLRPGAIILLHEGAPHGNSLAIVQAVLQRLDEKGYTTVLPPD